jgi:chemotaxis signal transduction protein
MSGGASGVMQRAAEMRRAFDRAFAEPVAFDETLKENFLAIRVGAQACAIRLSEIAGLFADKKVTRVPGGHKALRGIAGFRGSMLPVYDLQILLGLGETQAPRWLVIAKAAPIALAFDVFERQLRVPPNAIMPQSARGKMQTGTRDFLHTQEFSGPIIHLPSVLDAIKALRIETAPKEE